MTKRLIFVGDVWVGPGLPDRSPAWANEDTVINLEGPISRRGRAVDDKICLASDPDAFTRVFPVAPRVACLANNHIMDFGEEGFADTLGYLERRGIRYYGAGRLEERCNNPLLLNIDGIIVALMGYVCASTHAIFATRDRSGVARIELPRIADDIAFARTAGAERLVVSLHWGAEEVGLPKPQDIATIHALLDFGVDLIVGHHAHRRQPVFVDGGRHAFFGLGNAVFPDFEYRVDGQLKAWTRQRWWNNTGLVATFLPRSGVVDWRSHNHVDGGFARLAVRCFSVTKWTELPEERSVAYERRYRNAVRRAYARSAVSRFVARPRWPTITSVSAVLGQVLRGR